MELALKDHAADCELIPEWKILRLIGKNTVIQRAYIWFLTVPLAAKLILQFQSPFAVQLWGQQHFINLSLPFSWQQFFFASVAFTLGNLLFSWRCPPLVKDYSTPHDFSSAGNGSVLLCNELQNMPSEALSRRVRSEILYMFRIAQQRSNILEPSAQSWIDENGEEATPSRHEIADLVLGGLCGVKREEMGDLFAVIHNAYCKSRPWSRIVVTILYLIGFCLIAMVMASNIVSVMKVVNGP